MKPISFIASLPQTASAMKIDGNGGMKVVFEVPDSDLPEALKLTLLRGQVFQVTITELGKGD